MFENNAWRSGDLTSTEIAVVVGVVFLAIAVVVLVYRALRTYDAGAYTAFIATRRGEYLGVLRAPITLWNPAIKVLKRKHAPDISFITADATGSEHFEKSLVTRRTGEISLRVSTCAPRPFISRTVEGRQLRVRARVAFQLDIERIQTSAQIQSFGVLLGARIENFFDNAIGQLEDQDLRARQGEIEAKVLRQLQDIEFPTDSAHPTGMPLGIKVYEATFSFEPFSANQAGDGPAAIRGAMAYTGEDIDKLADLLEKASPATVETILRMMDLQTRQNIVEMLCKSGGLVAFTAQELGLSERPLDRKISGINRMAPVVDEPVAATPAAPGKGGGASTDPAAATDDKRH